MYYLLLLLSVVGIAVNFCLNKVYQLRVKQSLGPAFIKALATGALSAVMFFLMSGFCVSYSPFTVAMAVIMSVMGIISTCICFAGYSNGSIAIFTLFQMSGGMLIPFVFGIFYGNKVTAWQIVGIVLMLFSLVLPLVGKKHIGKAREKGGMSAKFLALCAMIFFVNGCFGIITYIYSNSPFSSGNYGFLTAKSMITVILSAAAYAVYSVISHKRSVHKQIECASEEKVASAEIKKAPSVGKKIIIAVALLFVGMTAADGISYLLQLISAAKLAAVAMYPMVTGGSVVFTAIAGRLFFGEKLTKTAAVGIALTFVATVLFIF